ncbi:MAG: DUF4838 domain-containing protein [Oscillospiraceae bacterium]|nr:DUF4838 domain-containing protein [Oscillospiraceae bacterium]
MLTIYKLRPDHTIDFAAEELKKYLRMMMPETGDILISYDPNAKDGFRLGFLADFDLAFTGKDSLLDDEYYIDMAADSGYIAGSNPRSVLFGVYRYLKKLGVRFLFPGAEGEFVPLQDITPVKYHKLADHRIRGHALEGDPSLQIVLDYIDYMAKQELNAFGCYGIVNYQRRYYLHRYNEKNRPPETLDFELADRQWRALYEAEVRKRGLRLHCGGHSLLPSAIGLDISARLDYKYNGKPITEEQASHMAMIGGKRGLHKMDIFYTNLCMSNPVTRKLVVDQLVKNCKDHPDREITSVSLADTTHNHCECPECQKKRPSDWLVVLLNECDEALTKEGIHTQLTFSFYVDTMFAPVEEKIKNPDRFSLTFCPIARDYLSSIREDSILPPPKPYIRNGWEAPETMEGIVSQFKQWEAAFSGTRSTYEYHYWMPQFKDLGMQYFSRRIYEDVLGLNIVGTHGCMEDGSNRSFWPNGFHDYIYNETLMNRDLDYDAEYADYYEHAYGPDWKLVKKYLEDITEAFDYAYMVGKKTEDPRKGDYFNPAHAKDLAEVKEICAQMREICAAHTDMPTRVQQIFWRNLRLHTEFCDRFAEIMLHKCQGRNKYAHELYHAFLEDFGKYDFELERFFDFGMCAETLHRIVDAKIKQKMEVI